MEFGFGFGTIAIIIVILYVLSSIKILAEYERGVIFRLGRLLEQAKGPGVILVFTPFDRMVRVSLRQEALEVPPQDIITRDNVTLKVNAVIFLRVIEPRKAVVEVYNYVYQTSQFAQTTLRSVLGEQELDFFFSSRRRHTISVSSFLLNRSSDLLPALTVKLSKYNVDDVALGVCKTGAEEAGVTEVRTSLSEKKFELWREIKV